MKVTEHTIHTAHIKNNCPECYSTEGLIFKFIQKEKENAWYKKAEKQLLESLYCTNCNTEIYPVRWDEHIERVYQYNKKLVQPLDTKVHLKKRSKILIGICLLLIAAILIFGGVIDLNMFGVK